MKLKVWLGVCAIVLSSLAAFAQEPKKKEMSAEEKAAMEAMMKAGTPGEQHKQLASFVGTWDATVKSYMQPGAPPQVSHGTATNKAILGGRYVQTEFSGDFMGMPYNGMGYWGYDNVKKQYVATWMDNMSTAVMMTTGKMDGPNQYTFTGSATDPMTGKDMPFTEKWTATDNDHNTFEMWGPAPDGKMFKMMEISYTRKKS
jgi:hypothetical protein